MPISEGAKPVIIIAGPTASGKSALAVDVAERFAGTVINADSMQVYRGLDVLSSSPDAAMKSRAPHRLYGILDPSEACSAGSWRDMALHEIDRAFGAGRLPVVVGGTGLYLRSLMSGIARMPPIPNEIRDSVRARLVREGSHALYDDLRRQDPDAAARLEPGDRQRIARAVEVLEATGRTLSDWQRRGPEPGDAAELRFLSILIMPPREVLYGDCDRRFIEMLASGALDEVRRLADRQLDPALPAMKALGVPELLRHIKGDISLDEACRHGRQATRRYAKRQVTWFRHQIIADYVIETKYDEKIVEEILSFISNYLLTHPG